VLAATCFGGFLSNDGRMHASVSGTMHLLKTAEKAAKEAFRHGLEVADAESKWQHTI
jgi:hypothetical protein